GVRRSERSPPTWRNPSGARWECAFSLQGKTLAGACGQGAAIDSGGRGDVLQPHACTVEQRDVGRAGASGFGAGDQLGQSGVDVVATNRTGGQGVVEVADLGRLFERIDGYAAGGVEAGH